MTRWTLLDTVEPLEGFGTEGEEGMEGEGGDINDPNPSGGDPDE